jgi:hypothetical protein
LISEIIHQTRELDRNPEIPEERMWLCSFAIWPFALPAVYAGWLHTACGQSSPLGVYLSACHTQFPEPRQRTHSPATAARNGSIQASADCKTFVISPFLLVDRPGPGYGYSVF